MERERLHREGWKALELTDFSRAAGPFWTRGDKSDRQVGFIAETRHANSHVGSVHGGVLMTFADVALGLGVVDAIAGLNCVTAQLQVQFVSLTRLGSFVTCRPEVVRRSRRLVFVRGLITVDETPVASADGIWKVLEPKAGSTPRSDESVGTAGL